VPLPSTGRPMLKKVPAAVAAERTKNSRRVEFQFFGLPLKFKGGSGSPVRAFAIVNE
jgi:kynurenine formamidase